MKANQLLHTAILASAIGAPIEACAQDKSVERQKTPAAVRLPIEGELPSLGSATAWLNSPPLTPAGLRGKVVLIDFWTYTCINWLRTLPYVRAWAEKYKDQRIGGDRRALARVRVREGPRQRSPGREGHEGRLSDRGRQRPRGLASLQQQLLAGPLPRRREGKDSISPVRRGRIRTVGRVIQQLLAEAGTAGIARDLVPVDPRGLEVPPIGAT